MRLDIRTQSGFYSIMTKRILHISSTSGPGGAEMLVSSIAAGLDRERFQSVVCLFSQGWLRDRCEALGLGTYVIQMNHQWDLRWVLNCCSLVRREGVSLIHAHEFRANAFGTLVARLCCIPIVATVHGKNYYPDRAKRRIAYRWVSRSARMVAVSHDLRQFLAEEIGVPPNRVSVIHNGVDPNKGLSAEQRSQLRSELGIQEGDFVLGVVGSLYEVKGHLYLLDAFKEVLRSYPNTKLLVIGQGDLEEALKSKAVEWKIERHVSFLGLRNDVPRLLSALDIFVLPSLSEGLSIALSEAMSAGIPVIASNVGGNPEIIVDGETGYLVPSRDAKALAVRILDLMADPSRQKSFGHRGRERVAKKFSTACMLEQYQALYDIA